MSHSSRSELISFWFAQTLDDPASITGRMGWWFSADQDRDRIMTERFSGLAGDAPTFGQ